MRSYVVFIMGLCFYFSASANDSVRYIFEGKNHTLLQNNTTLPLKRMTFGLSKKQSEKILRLTQGQVDFSNTFYLDAKTQSQNELLKKSANDIIYPNVLPPFTFQAAHSAVTPDPYLNNQWWALDLNVPAAWNYASGKGVTIADCDAGYYHNEPDLFPNMILNQRYDLSNQRGPYVVDDGSMTSHGTAVAAIMVGVKDGRGTNGIAYNAKLVPLQNYNYDSSDGLDKEEATARCVLRAISIPNVQIIVLENQTQTGSSETFSGTRNAVRLAIKSGIIVVGAAGNSGLQLQAEQQDDTGSIIVGAIDQGGSMSSFSNYGRRVDIAAFGHSLFTLHGPNGEMGYFGGTSGATPQVAATVALMKEVNPWMTPSLAKQILINTRITSYYNNLVGGQLNTEAAVIAARAASFTSAQSKELAEQQTFRQSLVSILADQ